LAENDAVFRKGQGNPCRSAQEGDSAPMTESITDAPTGEKKSERGRRMVVTDLDGTLYRSDRTFSATDLAALTELGRKGVLRVVATGRSLYSLGRAVGPEFPVDYVIFSSGAGVARHPGWEIVKKAHLCPEQVDRATGVFLDADLDFMIHLPIPENHGFAYHRAGGPNPDFEKRLTLYREVSRPLREPPLEFGEATQLLAVVPGARAQSLLPALRGHLPDFNVIRTTSPLDGRSTWVEVFPPSVSKGRTAAWLAAGRGIGPEDVVAVGNDYNDLDLLEWAGTGYVVENAPDDLKAVFPIVASNDRCGVAEAVELFERTGGVSHG